MYRYCIMTYLLEEKWLNLCLGFDAELLESFLARRKTNSSIRITAFQSTDPLCAVFHVPL